MISSDLDLASGTLKSFLTLGFSVVKLLSTDSFSTDSLDSLDSLVSLDFLDSSDDSLDSLESSWLLESSSDTFPLKFSLEASSDDSSLLSP